YLANGIYYFRLKQVDFDGTLHFSGVKSLQIEGNTNAINAFVVRAEELLYLEIPETFNGNRVNVALYDVTGKAIRSLKMQPNWQNSQFSIPLNGLSRGVYVIRVNSRAQNITQKVVF
ncbi:MAG: T9SS type A sorting domain-containing protein, partial [Bacteroidota bacterium]